MKKTITAIGNESIHNEYKRSGEYEVIGKDIQYQEGILEVFEEPNEIDLLIMSDFLPGYFSMRELIKKIKRKKNTNNGQCDNSLIKIFGIILAIPYFLKSPKTSGQKIVGAKPQ